MKATQGQELTPQSAMRYSRQIMLADFGLDKQEVLLASRVLQIGAGGLGCACAQYLVGAGIGKLVLVDDDQVESSNLQRQVLHGEQDIGKNKAESAAESLLLHHPDADVQPVGSRLNDQQLAQYIEQVDIIVDCSDNLLTRNQLNRLAMQLRKPLVSGAAIRMEGQVCCFRPDQNQPCYQCMSDLFHEQQLTCMEAGVMSPIVGIVGSMQALECIKLLTHFGTSSLGTLSLFDGMTSQWQQFKIAKNPDCPVCQK